MSILRFAILLLGGIWLAGCGNTPNPLEIDLSEQVTIRQGVWGDVLFWEGNFFPGAPTGKITPVKRVIYVYEPVSEKDVVPAGRSSSFFQEILTTFIDSTHSDQNGFYQLALPPGQYNVFIRENGLFYGGIGGSFTVSQDSVTNLRLNITYLSSS